MASDKNRHVRDVMTPNPECVSERDSIRDAARIMKDQDTGVVPVVDGKKVIGLITDRDIVVRGIAEGRDVSNASVNELMSGGPLEELPVHHDEGATSWSVLGAAAPWRGTVRSGGGAIHDVHVER